MEIKKYTKNSFSIIGKEGSTNDGEGFIQGLWSKANSHFAEIENLVKRDEKGNPIGFWGAMSDFSRAFMPWDCDFSRGLYLAGAEVKDDARAPLGWVKWTIPSYEYLSVKVENGDQNPFPLMIAHLNENNMSLVGAVNDFFNPLENGQAYMLFPIQRL